MQVFIALQIKQMCDPDTSSTHNHKSPNSCLLIYTIYQINYVMKYLHIYSMKTSVMNGGYALNCITCPNTCYKGYPYWPQRYKTRNLCDEFCTNSRGAPIAYGILKGQHFLFRLVKIILSPAQPCVCMCMG